MENVRAAMEKMNQILKAPQAEMSRCSEYYSATDHGEASRLDPQYPESKR
ncbi:hypothetical protein [Streptomyces viridochromogenes]|nr:hypothetical protein [Streptomyces viridochromogenes]